MKNIMKRAWEIAKNGKSQFGGSSREYLSSALKIAWRERKMTVKIEKMGIEELKELRAKIDQEIEKKSETSTIVFRNETDAYNERRYGKPWIANVDFKEDKRGVFEFGEWIGSTGGSGILELETKVGAIIAMGQKDYRKPKNSAPDFYFITGPETFGPLPVCL